jgi:hypothetical protein
MLPVYDGAKPFLIVQCHHFFSFFNSYLHVLPKVSHRSGVLSLFNNHVVLENG